MIDLFLNLQSAAPRGRSAGTDHPPGDFGAVLGAALEPADPHTAPAGHDVAPEAAAPTWSARARRPDSDPGKLDPELRARVDRVVRRMQEEYGHVVSLVEGARSQERQEYLFAQGRTRPGPVVTWTRQSHHQSGRAADLLVDGGYSDATAYQRLQRIANEEGLRTLGPRDPGHVELAASPSTRDATARTARGQGRDDARPTPPAAGRPDRPTGPVARPADVAVVATVAPVRTARVSAVAAPARPAGVAPATATGRSGGAGPRQGLTMRPLQGGTVAQPSAAPSHSIRADRNHPVPEVAERIPSVGTIESQPREPTIRPVTAAGPQPAAPPAASAPPATEAIATPGTEPSASAERGAVWAGGGAGAERMQRRADESVAPSGRARSTRPPLTDPRSHEPRTAPRRDAQPDPRLAAAPGSAGVAAAAPAAGGVVAPAAAVDMAARVEAMEGLRDRIDAQPVHRVTLNVGSGDDAARVRVDLRGDRVHAEMEATNQHLESRLQRELPSLVRALRSQGVEPEHLMVRRDGAFTQETTAARPAGEARSGAGDTRDGQEPGGHRPDRDRQQREQNRRNRED